MDAPANTVELLFDGALQEDSKDEANISHHRCCLYKAKWRTSHQEERRRQMLTRQKKQRFDYLSHIRNLLEEHEDENGEECLEESEMDWRASDAHKRPPLKKTYKNQLMLSEWFEEIPEDLESHWFLVLCPEGKRSLIIASNGITRCYSKGGYCIASFSSLLPGGNYKYPDVKQGYTVLDCIFNQAEKTYYILDLISWRGHPVYNSETEFRFYWVKAKLSETPDVQIHSPQNPYRFLPVPYYQCTKEELTEVLWSPMPFSPKLDGLLFYHKLTHYTPGSTPLVGWLKAYMVPEVLHVNVPDSMLAEKPAKYTCFSEHIKLTVQENRREKKKQHRNGQPMEVISADGEA